MTIHETIPVVLALLCGGFWGLGFGYRRATREYLAEIDRTIEAMQRGGKVIEKLRQRLASKYIVEMKRLSEEGSRG